MFELYGNAAQVFRKNIGSDGNKWAAAAVPLLTRRPWDGTQRLRGSSLLATVKPHDKGKPVGARSGG
jgi:hypothetical protein